VVGKHLPVDGNARIIAFSEVTALGVFRCLPIFQERGYRDFFSEHMGH
jgi:hypothetical protein